MHKNFFYFTDINVLITRFCCFISLVFDYQSLFLATFSQVLRVFFYFVKTNWKCSTKVQHVCCTLTCCTFLLQFFLEDLVATFNLGYTWYHIKDLLYNQSTILDWSEGKWNESVNLITFKTCNMCTTSLKLIVVLHFIFFSFFIYITIKLVM